MYGVYNFDAAKIFTSFLTQFSLSILSAILSAAYILFQNKVERYIGAAQEPQSPQSMVIKSGAILGFIAICLTIGSILEASDITILHQTGFHQELLESSSINSKNSFSQPSL
jgi:hypothetical protein